MLHVHFSLIAAKTKTGENSLAVTDNLGRIYGGAASYNAAASLLEIVNFAYKNGVNDLEAGQGFELTIMQGRDTIIGNKSASIYGGADKTLLSRLAGPRTNAHLQKLYASVEKAYNTGRSDQHLQL